MKENRNNRPSERAGNIDANGFGSPESRRSESQVWPEGRNRAVSLVLTHHNVVRNNTMASAMPAMERRTIPAPMPSAESVARFERPGYALMNVDEQHAHNPDTFEVPDLDLRCTLPQGCQVKLGFIKDGIVERMWCQLFYREHGGAHVGLLCSIPVMLGHVVQHGDPVRFWPCNILQVVSPDGRMVATMEELLNL